MFIRCQHPSLSCNHETDSVFLSQSSSSLTYSPNFATSNVHWRQESLELWFGDAHEAGLWEVTIFYPWEICEWDIMNLNHAFKVDFKFYLHALNSQTPSRKNHSFIFLACCHLLFPCELWVHMFVNGLSVNFLPQFIPPHSQIHVLGSGHANPP